MVSINDIVSECVKHYNLFVKKMKICDAEWTVISAIVGVINDKDIRVLSMGTGSKCIGKSFMSSRGDVLNDSHAEVIARRAFLKYLYHEIVQFNESQNSEILYYDGSAYSIKNSVNLHFVTSMSPCGDASIIPKLTPPSIAIDRLGEILQEEYVIQEGLKRKSSMDNTRVKQIKMELEGEPKDIYRTGAKCLPDSDIQDSYVPGISYHSTTAVRTKPGRGDPTLSLSCSDKIARWNAVGWQGALLTLFFKHPIFMETIICGDGYPFSKDSFDRAVNRRINRSTFVPIHQSNISFPNVKGDDKRPSSLSAIWSRTAGRDTEISVNGRRQGITKKDIHTRRARTSICKKELLLLFMKAFDSHPNKAVIFRDFNVSEPLIRMKYGDLKMLAKEYQRKWTHVKDQYFKVWSRKPKDLLNFTAEND